MRAGTLRNRITIERRTTTRNAVSELVPTWSVHLVVSAEKKQLTGNERYIGERLRAEVDTQWRIRFVDGLDPTTMRVKHVGAVYELLAVLDLEGRRRELCLLTKQQVR